MIVVHEDILEIRQIVYHAASVSKTGIETYKNLKVSYVIIYLYSHIFIYCVLDRTNDTIRRAGDIKKVGATGAYTKEFEEMQMQLEEIEKLLNNTDEVNLDVIEDELQKLRQEVNETENDKLNALRDAFTKNNDKHYFTEVKVMDLTKRIEELKNKTKELENNGTKLQETNVQGALSLVKKSKEKAEIAAGRAEYSHNDIIYAETQCKATETAINDTENTYKKQLEDNNKELDSLREKIDELNSRMPNLNNIICDGFGDPCDPICGGAGCSSCGNSISCDKGAKQKAETARTLINNTVVALKQKEAKANDFIRDLLQINTEETKNLAKDTYDKVFNLLTRNNETLNNATDLLSEIREFLSQNNTKPEDLKKLGEEVC